MDELKKDIPYLENPIYDVKNSKVNMGPVFNRYAIAVATTGLIRFEWHLAMTSACVPMCHGPSRSFTVRSPYFSTVGYHVAESRNILTHQFLECDDVDWLLFIDHDTLPNPLSYVFMAEYIRMKKYPIVAGLYFSKEYPSQPLVFRGTHSGVYEDWQSGDQVNVSFVPMGMTLIHRSILEWCSDHARDVKCTDGQVVKEVFRSPRDRIFDPQTNTFGTLCGTEDQWFCEKLISLDVFKETGWDHLSGEEYPFIVDTRNFCKHIDQKGQIWPAKDSYKKFNLEYK